MIRPPLPSEIFVRHNTRLNVYGGRLNHKLAPYRWAEWVLDVGDWRDQSAQALKEYFPNANVVALRKWKELSTFAPEWTNKFGVVICSVPYPLRPSVVDTLKELIKPYGLLVVEGLVEGCEVDTVNNTTVCYWTKGSDR